MDFLLSHFRQKDVKNSKGFGFVMNRNHGSSLKILLTHSMSSRTEPTCPELVEVGSSNFYVAQASVFVFILHCGV